MLHRPLFRAPHIAIARIAAVLALPILLASCALTPGKFTSTLTILADRSFTFTYVGEVYAIDPDDQMKGFDDGTKPADGKGDDQSPAIKPAAQFAKKGDGTAQAKAEREAKNQEIARILAKEEGYRSVTYVGDGKFMIDYAIRGSLTHGFFYPYNIDGEVLLPFIAIELRKGGVVRVTAPAFANDSSRSSGFSAPGMPGGGSSDMASKLDGLFTLTTDAEIVSQNNEDGPTVAGGHKTIVWKATPLTKTAPSAVLKLAPVAPVAVASPAL